MTPCLRAEFRSSLADLPASRWNALLAPNDSPLLSWHYLQALESSACVGPGTSWLPLHLLLWRDRSTAASDSAELIAAAPCYVKFDSDGEWVFDLDWAAFAESQGLPYYPKLVVAVPFNPVSGGRALLPPDLPKEERRERYRLVLQALQRATHVADLSSAHILFPRMDDELTSELVRHGFLLRRQEQYHFQNLGYRSFDDFLDHLKSHRRGSIRRERRVLREAGVVVRTHRGLDVANGFSREQLDAMFDLYCGTSVCYTGATPYLNREFFHRCAEQLGDRLELVLAHGPGGRLLGGAWNLRGDTRLFGRYWGVADDANVPFLHFEVCYYHSIERCINEGLTAFEPGHGGDHKLLRGFAPVYTHSAHFFREPALRGPIAAFLREEAKWVDESLAAASQRCPLRGAEPTNAQPAACSRDASDRATGVDAAPREPVSDVPDFAQTADFPCPAPVASAQSNLAEPTQGAASDRRRTARKD